VVWTQAAETGSSSYQSPSAPSTSVTTAKPSSAGRLLNLMKTAVSALLPSVVVNRSLSPSISLSRSTATTDRHTPDQPQALSHSMYVNKQFSALAKFAQIFIIIIIIIIIAIINTLVERQPARHYFRLPVCVAMFVAW